SKLPKEVRTRASLELVGSGPLEASFKERVRRLGLESKVHFHGYVAFGSGLERLYDGATLFILPSNTEGFPQVILEAMAAGIPVIATAVGGIPFLVRNGVNGLLIPPRNADALASAIMRLLSAPHLYQRLSSEGIKLVRQHTLEVERDRMLELIRPYLALKGKRT
ncbi:MAG: glycosyltransferase, partial [Acidobacteriota bacterium]